MGDVRANSEVGKFGSFYSFCSQLVVDAESQTRDQDVVRHVDVRTITFLEGLLLSQRSY